MWDVHTRKQLVALSENPSPVLSVAFSHKDRWIIVGNNDNMMQFWDATTYQPIGGPLRGHADPVASVVFGPDDTRVLSASTDATMQLWPAPTDLVQALCNKLNENISHKHWSEWVSPKIRYRKVCSTLPDATDE